MKLSFRLYRCVTVPQHWFSSLLGMPDDAAPAKLEEKLRQEFGPLAPRLQVWWLKQPLVEPDLGMYGPRVDPSAHAVIGVEAMAFDVTEQKIPCGGVCSTEPMDPQDVDRIDGALESELNRWGITTEFKDFQWRVAYSLTGQE